MGQKQTKLNNDEGKDYTQIKPQQILYLQKLLDQLNNEMLVKPKDKISSVYRFLIKSQIDSSYTYGFKFDQNFNKEQQKMNPQLFNFPIQIFLLKSQSQNKISTLIFEGQFFKGKRVNFGTQYKLNGQIFYQGNFRNNKYRGWGITSTYQGQWANGVKCGYGKFTTNLKKGDKEVIKYEGFWKNGKFDGLGIKNIHLNNSQNFVNDSYQVSSIEFDEQYIGEWVQGMKFGSGKLIKYTKQRTSENCQIYQGQFARDLYHGKGKLKINSENFQQGIFQAGKLIRSL